MARDKDDYVKDLEDEERLDEVAEAEVKVYEEKQLEIVPQTVDYNLLSLSSLIDNEKIDVKPAYQRRLRWTQKRQSRLIESFLLNVPVPPVYLSEDTFGRYSVIDGQQRLRAIHGFFNNEFDLRGLDSFPSLIGKTFRDLPRVYQNVLETRCILRAIILLKQSSSIAKYLVFQRLNTGGVSLNDQEIRNSAYRGKLNNTIIVLSENKLYRDLLRVKKPEKSAIVQKMRDCELILRFFALKDSWRGYSGNMRGTLNDYMENNQDPGESFLTKLKKNFLGTLEEVKRIFHDYAFRRFDLKKRKWVPQINAAMFDAQMIAIYEAIQSKTEIDHTNIIKRLEKLFKQKDFEDAIARATNDAKALKLRVERIKSLFG